MTPFLHCRQTRKWIGRGLLLSAALIAFTISAYSQSSLPTASPDPLSKDAPKDDSTRFGSPEAEMRSKLLLKEEKKRYDEHVARAKESSQLAKELSDSYDTHKAFSPDDQKKLERLEKLTKRIRNDAGGADAVPDADVNDIPADMTARVKKLASMADELHKLVENTPRNVVSAVVIDQANKLFGLIQHIRGSNR
ncbi:MAG: hypothetical protein ABR607_06125 [Pyrinomonadaceae bacterium]